MACIECPLGGWCYNDECGAVEPRCNSAIDAVLVALEKHGASIVDGAITAPIESLGPVLRIAEQQMRALGLPKEFDENLLLTAAARTREW